MYLERHLLKSFPARTRELGSLLFETGRVSLQSGNQWRVQATVAGSRAYNVELERRRDQIEALCECSFWDSEGICKHVWATVLAADRKSYLLGSVGSGTPRLVDVLDFEEEFRNNFETDEEHEEEEEEPVVRGKILPYRGAGSKPARKPWSTQPPKPPKPPAWQALLQQVNTRPFHGGPQKEWRANREIAYVVDPLETMSGQGLSMRVEYREPTKSGKLGKPKPMRLSTAHLGEIPDPLDREILSSLTGAADNPYGYGDRMVPTTTRLKYSFLDVLLPKICSTGRCRLGVMPGAAFEDLPILSWDAGEPWKFRMIVERSAKSTWTLRGVLERGGERVSLLEPALLLESGLVILRASVAKLDHGGAFPWISLLRAEKQIDVPDAHGAVLVAEILKAPNPPEIDWPEELRVEEVVVAPRPMMRLTPSPQYWERDKLRGQVFFNYDGDVIEFEEYGRGRYQPKEKRYLRRDEAAERAAIDKLQELGMKAAHPIYGETGTRWDVTNKKLPSVVRALAQAGWQVEAEGKTFRRASGFSAELGSGVDWFELRGAAEYGDLQVKLPELLKALDRGDQMVPLKDGSFGILPDEFLQKYGLLTRIGRAQEDHVRFSKSQAGLLDVLLAARPEIKVDQVFARARERMRVFEGVQPAPQPEGFTGELRGYQREGLAWMEMLRQFDFGGCLADDMGVGKTPQVLAMLETRRRLREQKVDGIGPSLAVVPRSLIYNWKQEAARFTPRLCVLDHTGGGRYKDAAEFDNHDLILTTYGTLLRDIMLLQDYKFDYVVLDEAQAIKNSGSESAKAARLLRANHRLALSGTPIENHLGELWSLLEFLNPGMLGSATVFQGAGSVLRNPDEGTRQLLSRALRPFILRRTKGQVVKELPEKLEQTIFCELDASQRKLYNELRDHYRQSLLGRIESEGLAKSKMHVLEALLRLRQAACHPGLLDKTRAAEPAAKLEALLPQLSEVMEEGHKALVFSQFTSFLSILRSQLDREKVNYEYLDGKTANRQARVERFQGDPACKLFLISLKAGGVGLNLTAAEYVFLLDPWWNPAVEAQAIDRTHRIGQTQPVFAYRLIAKDTVEEKVLELQQSKRALADAIIGEDNRLLGNLKREDLELLLS